MGIDYGRGITNVSDTYVDGVAIRYGVISQNELLQSWSDESEPFYGPPHCPECGNQLADDVDDGHKCDCGYVIKWIGDECYGDEPLSHYVDNSEYTAESDSYGDIFITRSPYFAKCGYCSPCAPGAGCLTSSGDDCMAFCFGPDWFDGAPPHDIYSVKTGELVCKAG